MIRLKLEDVKATFKVHLDGGAPYSDCGNAEEDAAIVAGIDDQLRAGNIFAWCVCVAEVTWGRYRARAIVGGCQFKDEDDARVEFEITLRTEALQMLNDDLNERMTELHRLSAMCIARGIT